MKKHITTNEIEQFIIERNLPDPITGCWNWLGYKTKGGYGRVTKSFRVYQLTKERLIHRISYYIFKGPIPQGMVIRHQCDNSSCCNPSHLDIGTQFQNVQDRNKGYGQMTLPALQNRFVRINDELVKVNSEIQMRLLYHYL